MYAVISVSRFQVELWYKAHGMFMIVEWVVTSLRDVICPRFDWNCIDSV
ncbi:hypothetical protein BamMEX5DRAFT_4142 [Burkholderia ambifaria MEX-5]|uniref:Uncharacterized protein n=1 Tax=Burkholderia ambifaria MEX-5 TaxID=396597 RepID=B1T8M6_9BURK|nr:hypothetical protein BamMEX5DRAFT_4142 [Burkholderia ambifaria MEX-5]